MGKIIRRAWGESRITEERKKELAELAKRPDSEIDFSDMPELTEEFWKNAVRNPWIERAKKGTTLKMDGTVRSSSEDDTH